MDSKDLVVIINGCGGSGKDLFVDMFKNNIKNTKLVNEIIIYNLSTIDPVKKAASEYFGWKGLKKDNDRLFLSKVKKIWKEYNNGPFEYIKTKVNNINIYEHKKAIIFVHSREPDEIEEFKDYFGENCITLLIKRRNIKIESNDSDKNVDQFEYDYYVTNNETKNELKKEITKFKKFVLFKFKRRF